MSLELMAEIAVNAGLSITTLSIAEKGRKLERPENYLGKLLFRSHKFHGSRNTWSISWRICDLASRLTCSGHLDVNMYDYKCCVADTHQKKWWPFIVRFSGDDAALGVRYYARADCDCSGCGFLSERVKFISDVQGLIRSLARFVRKSFTVDFLRVATCRFYEVPYLLFLCATRLPRSVWFNAG